MLEDTILQKRVHHISQVSSPGWSPASMQIAGQALEAFHHLFTLQFIKESVAAQQSLLPHKEGSHRGLEASWMVRNKKYRNFSQWYGYGFAWNRITFPDRGPHGGLWIRILSRLPWITNVVLATDHTIFQTRTKMDLHLDLQCRMWT